MSKKEKEPMSDKSKRSIRVALFVISAIVIFYLGANFLKGIDTFSKKTYYYTILNETGGLNVGSAVTLNGYPIGKITEMYIVNEIPFQLCVKLFIKEDVKIPMDSKIAILRDLMSSTVLGLELGNASVYAQSNDTLSSYSPPYLLDGLTSILNKVDLTMTTIDSIALSLKNVMVQEQGADNLAVSLNNLKEMTTEAKALVAVNRPKLDAMISGLTVFSKTLKESSPKLNEIVSNFDQIADTLAKAEVAAVINNANNTVENINSLVRKINAGEGDLGQLLNNDTLYRNLEMTTHNLNALMVDIKENPGRYVTIRVFGGKTKEERQAEKAAKRAAKENN